MFLLNQNLKNDTKSELNEDSVFEEIVDDESNEEEYNNSSSSDGKRPFRVLCQ